jgi:2'-5' RNA ligase
MSNRTHQTAVAVVPPPEVWGPIQTIREKHDRQFRRWMPHINLLYPFYPVERFAQVLPRLIEACAKITPLVATLAEFRFFLHPSRKATLWLAPEPRDALVGLMEALLAACPECDDLCRFAGGFTPHLSVGQAGSAEEAERFHASRQPTWKPISFEVSAVALLRREPDTPFEIARLVPLGGSTMSKGEGLGMRGW